MVFNLFPSTLESVHPSATMYLLLCSVVSLDAVRYYVLRSVESSEDKRFYQYYAIDSGVFLNQFG